MRAIPIGSFEVFGESGYRPHGVPAMGDIFGFEGVLSDLSQGSDFYATENARLNELARLKLAEFKDAMSKISFITDPRIKKDLYDWINSSRLQYMADKVEDRLKRAVPWIYVATDMTLSTRRADDLKDFRLKNRELRHKLAAMAIIVIQQAPDSDQEDRIKKDAEMKTPPHVTITGIDLKTVLYLGAAAAVVFGLVYFLK